MKKRIIFGIISGVIIVVICLLVNSTIVNCMLVNRSKNFVELQNNVFVQSSISDEKVESIKLYIEEANRRSRELFGAVTVSPTYIVITDEDLLKKYKGKKNAVTHGSLVGIYIIVGPDGIEENIISHEFAHGELFNRVGLTKSSKIPTWFNEGIATQVDYRERYSREVWNDITNNGVQIRDIKLSGDKFYTKDDSIRYHNYVLAKYEIEQWYKDVGREGLLELIKRVAEGEDFTTAYESIWKEI